ncbi:F0F1 ATP synthase subunit delta [Mobilicoccus pelagius]|uniref:ATP synthase subunit delta n=1 Tax=Mobilicoccus pelagius NBRC 104925 TaxID=1089455 RepID=H5UMS3_9MICO|nr:F0F1 ATP synthase subunit delta [Mobilicoccus pelagius]GAB47031.1 ATP synthase subunit delta [Mobilicoccus pelagius NBRC 104925]
MDGLSRGSWTESVRALNEALPGIDARTLAGELFAVGEAIDGNSQVRRAVGDPSREAEPKRELVRRLFGGRIAESTMAVLETVVGGRWATERDLVDALERLGFEAVFAAAEQDDVVDRVEDELFRFERLVAADKELDRSLSRSDVDGRHRAQLVIDLLAGRALPDTVWLAQRPLLHPRGRKFAAVMEEQFDVVSRRRDQMTAVVTSAVPLSWEQQERLAAGLARVYGHKMFVTVAVDPSVLGGLRVKVGGELIDGTVARRLEDVRRAMGAA